MVSQQLAHNVVGMIEGSDPKLKDTYVMYGAHLDHNGYSQAGTGNRAATSGCRNRSDGGACRRDRGRQDTGQERRRPARRLCGAAPSTDATRFDKGDYINNGADDDGSGSATLMGVARAFAAGPKPKRSIVVIWHVGEEAGLLGSRYNADFPIVPLAKVQAVLNMDMVGRDDCDDLEGDYTNSVFLVGDDRISTDLHNVIVQANQAMTKPLTLDYEMNDPADPEGVYTRSDHFSYASQGHPGGVLHDRPPSRLPPGQRFGGEDPVPEDGAHRPVDVRIRLCDRGDRGRARARQQGTAGWLREQGRDHQEVRASSARVVHMSHAPAATALSDASCAMVSGPKTHALTRRNSTRNRFVPANSR